AAAPAPSGAAGGSAVPRLAAPGCRAATASAAPCSNGGGGRRVGNQGRDSTQGDEESRLKPRLGPAPEGALRAVSSLTGPSREITEDHTVDVAGSFGAITQSSERRHRALDVDLRVGDFRFDNTHPLRGGFPGRAFMSFGDGMAEIPVDDDPGAIRAALWYATDRRYKRAVEQLTWVKTNAAVGVA